MPIHLFRKIMKIPAVTAALCAASVSTAGADSPVVPIFVDGRFPDERTLTVGDPENWLQAIVDLSGASATGKVRISPDKFRKEKDTFRAVWAGEDRPGDVSIYGGPVNLASRAGKSSLIFDVKVHTPPEPGSPAWHGLRLPLPGTIQHRQHSPRSRNRTMDRAANPPVVLQRADV